MARFEQGSASLGSQKRLQILVNERQELIDRILSTRLGLGAEEHIHWLSPLKEDNYAEYRDGKFIRKLGIRLDRKPLGTFWPRHGPQWDGLAKSDRGDVLLVEAKAHIPELITDPTGAKGRSLAKICSSLNKVKQFAGSHSQADWSTCFYQYCNRLAHLYLLRELNGLPTYMVFLYFVNDQEMDGPTTKVEWTGAIRLLEEFLGLKQGHKLSPYVIDVFVNVTELGPEPPTNS